MIQPHRGEALIGIAWLAAQKIPPEREILQHAQGGLQRVAVAEIMGLL
jgi:hypothetical protein